MRGTTAECGDAGRGQQGTGAAMREPPPSMMRQWWHESPSVEAEEEPNG